MPRGRPRQSGFGKGLATLANRAQYSTYKRWKNATSAVAVNKKVNRINRLLKPEMKHLGFVHNANIPVNEAVVTDNQLQMFGNLDKGLTAQTRMGNKVRLMKLKLRMMVRNTSAAQNIPNNVRISVVLDREANKTTFSLDQLRTSDALAGFLSPTCLPNEETLRRFKILYDHSFVLGGRALPNNEAGNFANKIIIKNITFGKEGYVQIYDNAATLARPQDIEDGTIWLLVRANGGTAVGPSLDLAARLYFTDV